MFREKEGNLLCDRISTTSVQRVNLVLGLSPLKGALWWKRIHRIRDDLLIGAGLTTETCTDHSHRENRLKTICLPKHLRAQAHHSFQCRLTTDTSEIPLK